VDGLATAGDCRLTNRQNSWDLQASFSSTNWAAETIRRHVRRISQLFWNIIKEVLIKTALTIVRLCHHWVSICWVDPLVHHVSDNIYDCGMNIWWGRTNIPLETTKYIYACIINLAINDSGTALMLCCTSWTNLWQNPNVASFQDWQTIVDGRCEEGDECWVGIINQQCIYRSRSSYAIYLYMVFTNYHFSRCKLKLAHLHWTSW